MRLLSTRYIRSLLSYNVIFFFWSLILFVFALLCGKANAQERDTLSSCRPGKGYVYFRNPDVLLQAARFVNPAPGYLREVILSLGGISNNGTARLRFFGHEGGVPAPVIEKDLIEPIRLRKSKSGFERITVSVPQELFLDNNQFFVAVDQLDSGVVWLSDQVEKSPFCTSGGDIFYNQLLKESDGNWRWEKFSFAVDVVMDYPEVMPKTPMGNVASGLNILDTLRFNRSIAWADVDKDGYLDLLWDGRLYMNREGKGFERRDVKSGLSGSPAANFFLDANNDGKIDILFVGSHDTAAPGSRLFLGEDGNRFRRIDLGNLLPDTPTSLSIGDVDNDGFLDLFVGGACDSGNCRCRLLLNTGGTGFRDASDHLLLPNQRTTLSGYGSQFVDLDLDGYLDLYVARHYPERSILFYNDGTGHFAVKPSGVGLHTLEAGSGGDWKDFDNDGDPDLLYPRLIHPWLRKYRNAEGSGIYQNREESDGALARLNSINSSGVHSEANGTAGIDPIAYEERHSGGVWGDVNNDGLLDAFFTTAGDCRFAELYVQQSDHTFASSTFDYGLHWSSAGEDGIWVDFDNDGWLDLCAIEWGHLLLYRNPGDGHEKSVEIDVVRANGADDIGATATVYVGGRKISRDVTVGRGVLMGDPPRLHYGLGSAAAVDSVIVRWSDGVNEVFTDVKTGEVNRLIKGSSGNNAAAAEARISAIPNPFSSELHITYHLPRTEQIRLEIYDRSGSLVKVLVNEEVSAGDHSVIWTGTNGAGGKVSSGVYLYRLILSNGEVSGRAVFSQ